MLPIRNKRSPISRPEIPRFEIHSLNETGMYVLAFLFFGSAFAIVLLIAKTLIPLLDASQLLIAFGAVGFLIAFLLRSRLGLSIADGLYYNVFGGAPVAMVSFLFINTLCSETYTETYRVASYDRHSNRYTFNLENDAYAEYWRIRTINIESRPARTAYIEFTFCDGVLGYRVLKNTELR